MLRGYACAASSLAVAGAKLIEFAAQFALASQVSE